MTEILIHAGNLKTGTTAIQAVLRKMRPVLAEHGIVMPSLQAGHAAHYAVADEWRADAPSATRPASTTLVSALRQLGVTETPLLTAETFMGADPWTMHDVIGQVPDRQPRFLFYMRPHAGLLASMYLHLVKIGKYSAPLADLVPRLMQLPAMRFIDVVNGYADEFGDEAITVREFNREMLVSGSVIADFWDAFGLPEVLLDQALATETISNPTPTLEMSVLLRAWRLHLVEHLNTQDHLGVLREPVLDFFKTLTEVDLPGQTFRLPVALQEELAEQWEGPRANFAMRWFQLPPSSTWLKERIVAPTPPQPLPFEKVEAAAMETAKRLRRLEKRPAAAQMAGFLASLPVEADGGTRMIDIAALERAIAPADSVKRRLPAGPARDSAAPKPSAHKV